MTESAASTASLFDYHTAEDLGPATDAQVAASDAAAERDGGRGVIEVDGRSVYTQWAGTRRGPV